MERRSSPRFLKFTIALGLGVAVLTSTMRADPGALKNPFHFQMCTGDGSLTVMVKQPAAPVPPATSSGPCAADGSTADPAAAPSDRTTTVNPATDASPVADHPKHRKS